jgi:hypothetical protein
MGGRCEILGAEGGVIWLAYLRANWPIATLAVVTLILFVVVLIVGTTDDRAAKFVANCRAAGFSDQQCVFLHAVDRRRAADDDPTITAATLR